MPVAAEPVVVTSLSDLQDLYQGLVAESSRTSEWQKMNEIDLMQCLLATMPRDRLHPLYEDLTEIDVEAEPWQREIRKMLMHSLYASTVPPSRWFPNWDTLETPVLLQILTAVLPPLFRM